MGMLDICVARDIAEADRLFKRRWLNAARVLRWGAAFCEKI